MNIEHHYTSVKNYLELAMVKLNTDQHDGALNAFASAYSEVRELLDHTWHLKCKKAQESAPSGGD